ncbi:MAG: hypothetical protein J5669_06605 [Bacteroidales bacterium]|nr:hypothetical protein [Bacteroidales bacterium]
MKKTIIALLLAFVGAALFAQENGHMLTALWKQYQEAASADLPKKEAEILSQIKQEAMKQHLPVDFWDAATQYVWTVQRRDWKQQEALHSGLKEEVERFAEPIVTFQWMSNWDYASRESLLAYYQDHSQGFQGRHPGLWDDVDDPLDGALEKFLRNDAEYVLWYLLPDSESLLLDQVQGVYPNQAALEYYKAGRMEDGEAKKQALQELVKRYEGKAVSLFPRADLLWEKKRRLDKEEASEQEFKLLHKECKEFEQQRKAFTGQEATIAKKCLSVQNLIETLTAKSIQVRADRSHAEVILRNLSGAQLTLYQDKMQLNSWKLQNTAGSFYVLDTLKVDMPSLPDGKYTLEAVSGKEKDRMDYRQYTLSIAGRSDSRGRCVYVADYITGAPLKQVTLVLKKGDTQLSSTVMKLDGFTPLPEAFLKLATDKRAYYTVEAVSGDRRSRELSLPRDFGTPGPDTSVKCNIYKDRGAYNPGDTLHFKAVLYEGDPSLKLSVCKGKTVEVLLRDTQYKVLQSQTLTTGELGSLSGSFVLPTGLRNGYYTLEIKNLASDRFRVDEYVLPSFEIVLDKRDSLYLAGDSVPVSGLLKSYSGHNLSGAQVRLRATCYGTLVLESVTEVEAGNRFHFRIPAAESGYYQVELSVTDATGETWGTQDNFYVGDALSVETSVEGVADADLVVKDEEPAFRSVRRKHNARFVVHGKEIKFMLQALDAAGGKVPLPVDFQVLLGDKPVAEGRALPGETVSVNPGKSGLYTLKTSVSAKKADGTEVKGSQENRILLILPGEKNLDESVRRVFVAGPATVDGSIEALLGSSEADVYAIVTLYGKNRQVLESRSVKLAKGSLNTLKLEYKASYPDAVSLQVFYFMKDDAVTFQRVYRRAKTRLNLPLSFTRFTDKAYPGTRYNFTLKTDPGVEALAAAWDKSLDAIASNDWPVVTLREVTVEQVSVMSAPGEVTELDEIRHDVFYNVEYGAGMIGAPMALRSMTKGAEVMDDAVAVEESVAKEEADVPVRSVFSQALTFQPHLRPAADGTLSFNFCTSDKLSTYYVRVYAHDASMRNAIAEQEMVVSLPVKVSLQEPRFLYEGDIYEAAVTVSSIAETPVSGKLTLSYGDTEQQVPVTVPAGETVTHSFLVRATGADRPSLTLTAAFRSTEFSDAVRVTVPVYPAAQTLTEAHSAVLLDGMDREALLKDLRSRFVNVPAAQAVLREISVLDMVRDAIPTHVEPAADDVLSLTEAWYVRLMAGASSVMAGASSVMAGADRPSPASEALLPRILACRNADGGFGWFPGMSSSPIITAVVLERMAKLRDRGFEEVPDLASSVQWLDQVQLGETRPVWCGWLSDAQYMHVRALYASVPFSVKLVTQTQKDRVSAFRKEAKNYLVPSRKDGRGLEGHILEKARRLMTLKNLQEREGGAALLKAWGVSLAKCRLKKSMEADIASLLEYAVEHRDGGWYYPNAVMPWRGLLESEAYAHSLLCDLLTPYDAKVADGIRLWLMLQKETQQWDADPAFVDAITSILDGSQAVLNTRVMALSASYTAPFEAVKAAGNGFTVERQFFKNEQPLASGEPLSVGDKVTVKYQIWNAENRSFVRLTAGREAALRPVQQLSGYIGGGFIRPRHGSVYWTFTPQGYRNVKAACTEFCFDSYPEENTTLTEEFFVIEAGTFQAPVVVVESLYAPHYRANSAYRAPLTSK